MYFLSFYLYFCLLSFSVSFFVHFLVLFFILYFDYSLLAWYFLIIFCFQYLLCFIFHAAFYLTFDCVFAYIDRRHVKWLSSLKLHTWSENHLTYTLKLPKGEEDQYGDQLFTITSRCCESHRNISHCQNIK